MSDGNHADVMLSQSIDPASLAALESIANGESTEVIEATSVEEKKPYSAPSLEDLNSKEAVARVSAALGVPAAMVEQMLPKVLSALTNGAPLATQTSGKELLQQPEEEEPIDPSEAYVPLPENAYAWEPPCYERINEHGCAPIAGALLFRRTQREDGKHMLWFKLTHPAKVLDRAGRIRTVREGSTIAVTENIRLGSLAQYAGMSEGCISVFIQPTEWIELSDGSREYGYLIKVEPDGRDPRRMRLVPREVVEGRR